MKQVSIVILFLVCFCNFAFALTPQKLKIEEATVFLNGAQLVSTTTVTLAKGENEFLFTNVAGDVNSQSLSVNATNGVIVESATFKNDYLTNEVLSPRAAAIKDSIESVTVERQQISNKITMLNEQITVIQTNRKVSGENTGLNSIELQKMLDLINTKFETLLNQKNKNEVTLKKLDELLAKMNKQLDEERKRDFQPGGQLVIKFYANDAITSNITISYIVPHAGWTPSYDIRVDNISQPVKLYYKANIFQNSGVKWDNVRLSLSTGNPNEGVQAPNMNPWYLSFYEPVQKVRSYKMAMNAPSLGGMAPKNAMLSDNMEESTINNYVTVDNSGISTSFDIELPYTIPSDGNKHLVAIKKYNVPATYRYFAVPKLDKDAFLQAQITNWEDLNLMSGQSNIFYEGTYIGQGNLDVRNVKDTLTVSLGRDKKIVVKRERDKKLRSVKTIGNSVRETFAYSITVRNTRKEKINLTIQDQQPVSNDKDIEIEDRDTENSEYDALTGTMKWDLSVNPNESQTLKFAFTIKYPKGKTVDNLPK